MEPLDVARYARLMAELAAASKRREEVLARHGLDEERWAAIDTEWQDRLSAALAEAPEDAVPEILSAYTRAYGDAQRELAACMPIEQFAAVTRVLETTGDLQAALSRAGTTLAEYVRSNEHWARRMIEDPDLAARFEELLRRGS